jgi:hypothetical protein
MDPFADEFASTIGVKVCEVAKEAKKKIETSEQTTFFI